MSSKILAGCQMSWTNGSIFKSAASRRGFSADLNEADMSTKKRTALGAIFGLSGVNKAMKGPMVELFKFSRMILRVLRIQAYRST
jgi:hypothetical protein